VCDAEWCLSPSLHGYGYRNMLICFPFFFLAQDYWDNREFYLYLRHKKSNSAKSKYLAGGMYKIHMLI